MKSSCHSARSVVESSVLTHEEVSTWSFVTTQRRFISNPKEEEEEEEQEERGEARRSKGEREHKEKLNAGPYVSSSHGPIAQK